VTDHALSDWFDTADLTTTFPERDIPVLTGLQRQGDVLVLPDPLPAKWPRKGPKPLNGVVLAASETKGHTHTLYGFGQVLLVEPMSRQQAHWWWFPENSLGWLKVSEGGQAFLVHSADHGILGIGPGTYNLLRQAEYDLSLNDWHAVGD